MLNIHNITVYDSKHNMKLKIGIIFVWYILHIAIDLTFRLRSNKGAIAILK